MGLDSDSWGSTGLDWNDSTTVSTTVPMSTLLWDSSRLPSRLDYCGTLLDSTLSTTVGFDLTLLLWDSTTGLDYRLDSSMG